MTRNALPVEIGTENAGVLHGARLLVMMSYPAGQPQGNPYRVILDRALDETGEVTVKHFTWRAALLGRYDVFHAHWPEALLHGRTRARLAVRQAMFAVLLARLRLTRTPIVRTQHNVDLPQGLDKVSTALLRRIDKDTRIWIRLNAHTEVPDPGRCVDSTHGHYREWFAGMPTSDLVPGRAAFFGLVRRYKGVDRLIEAFHSVPGDAASLHVVGRPTSDATRHLLLDKAGDDPRVTLRLEMVDEAELVKEISSAQLVVLPYTEMHNSAAVITALSLSRPVLVPANTVTTNLAKEVGPEWVRTYEGELISDDIARALGEVADLDSEQGPDLSGRDWPVVAASHVEAYRRAVEASSTAAAKKDVDDLG